MPPPTIRRVMGLGSWRKTFTQWSRDTGTLQSYILIHTNWDSCAMYLGVCSVNVCICVRVCTCTSRDEKRIYSETLLEGQYRHWSMQILHHLSIHIGYICSTYCLAPLPISCDIIPSLLLSSPSLSFCLSSPPSISPICIFHFSSPEASTENLPAGPL